jgi:PLD-like domain
MNSEDVARLHGKRPGFQLISYRDVALPVFKVRLKCLFLEEKAIPPIQEFVLRCVDDQLDDVETIAGFLGVRQGAVREAAVDLMRSDDLVLEGQMPDQRAHRLMLTSKGRETLKEAKTIVSQERQLPVVLDGLTRQITIEPRGNLIKPAAMKDMGLVEIAPYPRGRPELEDFTTEAVAQAVRKRRALGGNLIAVLDVEVRERFFRADAVALVFKSSTDDSIQVGLAINGKLSEDHERAFSNASKGDFSLLTGSIGDAAAEIRAVVPPEIMQSLHAPIDTSDLITKRDVAAFEVAELEQQIQEADVRTDTEDLRRRLAMAEQRQAEAEALLAAIPVRGLEVHEHPTYLRKALEDSRERLLIVSPWIRGDVVDAAFVLKVEQAVQRGVDVFIGYGLDGEQHREFERDRQALHELERLAAQYSHMHLVRFGDTHAKVLVCDRSFAIVTSFNWLSFRGDPRRSFRDERGIYVGMPDFADAQFLAYEARFSSIA